MLFLNFNKDTKKVPSYSFKNNVMTVAMHVPGTVLGSRNIKSEMKQFLEIPL